jgi:hypothetical protein
MSSAAPQGRRVRLPGCEKSRSARAACRSRSSSFPVDHMGVGSQDSAAVVRRDRLAQKPPLGEGIGPGTASRSAGARCRPRGARPGPCPGPGPIAARSDRQVRIWPARTPHTTHKRPKTAVAAARHSFFEKQMVHRLRPRCMGAASGLHS